MSEATPAERADKFLRESGQFRLGSLLTESFHPHTRELSQTAARDIPAALKLLFEVDADVVSKYREWQASGAADAIAVAVRDAVLNGGKVFCTGCGSTGRLSIQLASIWRDFWQRRRADGQSGASRYEDRVFSVMAGGDFALIKAVEGFEDFTQFGRRQIRDLGVSQGDVVFAITEGGETSFVIGTAWEGLDVGAKVFFVYNNPDEVLRENVIRSREVLDEPRIQKINLTTGPMAISGSTRMQATTIQLAVMLTIFEMALADILTTLDEGESGQRAVNVPAQVLQDLEFVHARLQDEDLLRSLGHMVEMEEAVYRSGHRNNYYADRLAIDVLTDTTERSPTFCVPAFKKFDDGEAAESWAFLYLPYETSEKAWKRLLKRGPRPVEWDYDTVEEMLGEELARRQHAIISQIGLPEIFRFRIGMDGLHQRPLGEGDSAAVILTGEETSSLMQEDGFYRQRLEEAARNGAQRGLIFIGTAAEIVPLRWFADDWDAQLNTVLLQIPESPLLLQPALRLGAKMMLNALSTCTMVRLGRVMGNVMIWVVPSNLKLIDRSSRYIAQLADVPYDTACHELFKSIQYVSPRMRAGQDYPAVVGLTVMRLRHNLTNEEAEKKLREEVGRH